MILHYKDPEEARAKSREHGKRPEVKARRKERSQLPEVKAAKRKYGKEYVKKHRLELNKKTSERNLKVKHEVLSHYSKKLSNSDVPCCNCCGEHEFLIFLSIDHITNRKNITHKKGDAGQTLYRYLRRNGYPSGHQVLCFNCNSAKSDSGICPHKRSGG